MSTFVVAPSAHRRVSYSWYATRVAGGAGFMIVLFLLLGDRDLASGFDSYAYWRAGRAVLSGAGLYGAGIGPLGAFHYPPVFAQLVAIPATVLPIGTFVWTWRALEFVGLRAATGSWRWAGIVLLFPPVIWDLQLGNVGCLIAGGIGLAMRGDSRFVVPVGAATKFASFVAIPHGWFHDRRGLLAGAAVAVGAWGASIALSPASWSAYVDHLATIPPPAPSQLLVPVLPLAVQLAGAGILSLAAIRWVRLLPVATLLAFPVIGVTAPAVLAACLSPVRSGSSRASQPSSLPFRA